MKNYHEILADKIKGGENVALYCYGLLATHMLLYLEKFYGVLPAVVIDNDPRKTGTAEFGVPVMSFAETQKQFDDLQYFICSDDYKYTIIGDMLEQGVPAEKVINYVPVEKRRTCLFFYTNLIQVWGSKAGTHIISHCNDSSFKPKSQIMSTNISNHAGSYTHVGALIDKTFSDFESGTIELCKDCPVIKEQYMVSREYKKRYKTIIFCQESCADCLAHCAYCCAGGNTTEKLYMQENSLESYRDFVDSVLALDRISDDSTCLIVLSERDLDRRIAVCLEAMEKAGVSPLSYDVSSCLFAYHEHLAELMRQGRTYVIWSLDAGTRETYRKVKQIDAFDNVMKNVRRYIEQDAFGGKLIVAKYLILKGVNDNEAEFDAFLRIVTGLKLKFISLSFDFYAKADQDDLGFIQKCYQKVEALGLQLTYKNNSLPVTQALRMNNILTQ